MMVAQVKTTKSVEPGQASQKVEVERGEVVYIVGNDLVVKMENGEIRHFTVPEGAKGTVDGREIGIADLKPGMKLERTITTTSAQQTVKTVKTGTGTVVNVMAPSSVTVRFEDNSVQSYKVPKDQVFMIDGQKKTVFELKKGMKIQATRIVEEPTVVVSTARRTTGSAPPPPVMPPIEGVLLIAEQTKPTPASVPVATKVSEPTPAEPAPAEPAAAPAKKLPTTGSVVPLIGFLGLLFSGASLGIRMLRK